MRNILIYTGKGAYQAKDMENFLSVFDFDYERVCEHNLNIIDSKSILIIPGGRISDYLPSWGTDGIKKIRSFVKSGGIYIGICAGTYIAGSNYKNHPGLNFINREFAYAKRLDVIKIQKGKKIIELLTENGPKLQDCDGETILRDSSGDPQLIKIQIGKGSVYLFASHPEGSIYYNKYPKDFSGAKFFKNFLKLLIK